jgi:hypothetical protein
MKTEPKNNKDQAKKTTSALPQKPSVPKFTFGNPNQNFKPTARFGTVNRSRR